MRDEYNADRKSLMKESSYTPLPNNSLLQDRKKNIAKALSLYSAISDHSMELLSRLGVKNVELKRHQKLFFLHEGKPKIFIVKRGWVSICQSVKSHGQDICNVYMPGDIVGLRESFFDNSDVAILALQNCVLERISADDIHALLAEHDDIRKAIFSYIMVNDNISIVRLRSCTHHKAEERVAHFLLEVYARYRFKHMIDSDFFTLPVTQEVIGELLGITSVHVSRCMTALEQKKLIRKSRTVIKLLEPELLKESTGFDERLVYGHVYLA
ncbi:Crp/Fnr family transcriptional regulator [Halomonas sp. 707D7]|uniref:Crp/Fnr family transcriptional regulator n=2 Tax=unclassified Halomonas TaxID=2609666 RepID=UPI00209DA044|nr:Crp/Fnr family transcriptional regulator [Halomonas sp. 707D7]MCP1314509.1 Crp/Fnr family transcriptional regulator [Halomonas sp. 707D7]